MEQSFFTSIHLKVLLIPLVFTIHELEEWNILTWYKKHYKNIPYSTNLSIRIWIICISLLIFIVTIVAVKFIHSVFLFSPLFIAISTFILTNIIQHVIWTIQYKDYSVGLSTAMVLLAVIIVVHANLIINHYINVWFYVISLYMVVPIIKTLRRPHVMTPEIRGIHNLGITLEKLLFKKDKCGKA